MDQPPFPAGSAALTLTHNAVQRLARQSATCKLTSAILSGTAMLLASGRVGGEGLLWAAAPVGLLALADAGYTAKVRRLADAAVQFDAGKAPKLSELIRAEVGGGGLKEGLSLFSGLASSSVWPYYACLAGVVAGLGMTALTPKTPAAYPSPISTQAPLAAAPGQLPAGSFPQQAPRPGFGSPAGAFPAPGNAPSTFQGNRTVPRFPGANPAIPGGTQPGAPSSLRPPGPVAAGAKPPVTSSAGPTTPPPPASLAAPKAVAAPQPAPVTAPTATPAK